MKKQMPATIFVVDDEVNMTRILSRILEAEGYRVRTFNHPKDALSAFRQDSPDLVLTDLRMPEINGIELLKRAKEYDNRIPVIMMTAFGTIENAVEAMRLGALDYVTKPFQTDDLLIKIEKALSHRSLVEEHSALSSHLTGDSNEINLIGESKAMNRVRDLIKKCGPADSPVLLTGESGTGKELVARAIHHAGPRARRRFVPINCASIPGTLLESELFGHEKGAFTGAHQRKLGLVELASGGTLFLDEIGELPLHLQPKLLRMLQEREVRRVGGAAPISVDIRLIAATNRDLAQEIRVGNFREDLYYRLNVIKIEMPPLRERKSDIPHLVEYFAASLGNRLNGRPFGVTPEAMEILKSYPWPGNIRELENILERTIVLMEGDEIDAEDLPQEIADPALWRRGRRTEDSDIHVKKGEEYRESLEDFEKQYLSGLLDEAGGNVSKAARRAGISRRNFYEKLEKLGLAAKDFKE